MKKTSFSITLSYAVVSTILWLSYSLVTGYAAAYLLSHSFSSTLTGVLLSAASILAIVLQTFIGFLSDRSPRCDSRFFLVLLFSASTVLSVLLCCIPSLKWILGLSFGLLVSLQLTMATLIYTLATEYMNAFPEFRFGPARAVGSLVSAAGMSVMGFFLTGSSPFVFPCVLLLLNLICSLFTFFLLPHTSRTEEKSAGDAAAKSRKTTDAQGYLVFLKNHPHLLQLFLGMLLIYMSATSVYNFQINILDGLGAGSKELGISCAIGCISEVPFMFAFSFFALRFCSVTMVRAGAFFYVLKIVIFFLASKVPMVYLAQMLQGPSYALLSMFSVCYINEHTADNEKAKGQALLGMLSNGLSGIFSNIMAGRMMDTLGVRYTILALLLISGTGFLLVLNSLRCTSSATQKKFS